MITGDFTSERIQVAIGLIGSQTYLDPEMVTFDIRRGGKEYGPYRGGPDVGTATINLYYAPGVTPPTSAFIVGEIVVFYVLTSTGTVMTGLFMGNLQDFTINYVLDPSTNTYGQSVTLYVVDLVGYMQQVIVPGMITSATTKNVSWEERMNTLSTYVPLSGGFVPLPTSPENHVYRLVDNNLQAPLTDHFDLACKSVGATWYVRSGNTVVVAPKGAYPSTGILFTDEPNYWNAGNNPGVSYPKYNIEFSELVVASDTANIVNTVNMTNIMPRNIITATSGGALLYKDPEIIPGPSLPVLEQPYTSEDASSISTYGRRTRELITNVYPYRTTDTDSYYLRFNAALDPGSEYQRVPQAQVQGTMANATISNVTPRTGTYCTNITIATAVQSFGIYVGPREGYPLTVRPTANVNPFTFYFRTSIAKARYRKGISYLDSSGNVLNTQVGTLITPTVNVWGTSTATFMNFATIPAGAVAWRPYFNIESSDGTNFAVGNVFKLDDYAINPVMEVAQNFSGDNPDTASVLYSWEDTPGDSFSYMTRNVLDDIGDEVLTYFAAQQNNLQSITFNARQNWETLWDIEPGCRVDTHFNGANYTSFITTIQYRADNENLIVTLGLSTRPLSWI
jgi:hypothetical protein